MKLPNEILEESQLRQLKISCLKMVNGLLALSYIAITVWTLAKAIQIMTG